MDWNIVDKKLKLLGYDFTDGCLESFKTVVLKLEEEQIRFYEIPQRGKLKASDPNTWMKGFLNYCRDLGVPVEKDLVNGKDLSPKGKIYVLNKLLNIAIKEKYQDLAEEGRIHDVISTEERNATSGDIASIVAQINTVLAGLHALLLEEDAGHSEIKSALRMLLSCVDETRHPNTDACDNETIYELCGVTDSGPTDKALLLLRSLYTHDLRKLQSDIIWLTKCYSKMVGTQGCLIDNKQKV